MTINPQWAEAGFINDLLPIVPADVPGWEDRLRGKVPAEYRNGHWVLLKSWEVARFTREQIAAHLASGANLGLRTARFPCVDIDCDDEAAADAIRAGVVALLGPAPCRYRANSPRTALLFRTDQPFKKMVLPFTLPDGIKHKVEILGDGQQVVVAGRHNSGATLQWDAEPFAGLLPELTEALAREALDALRDELAQKFGATFPEKKNETAGGGEKFDLIRLLRGIPDNNGRDDAMFKGACSMQARGYPEEAARILIEHAVEQCNQLLTPGDKPYSIDKAREKVERAYSNFTPPVVAADYPIIHIAAGELPHAVDAAERAIIENVAGIYQRADLMVRVAVGTSDKHVRRADGAVTIHKVTTPFLTDLLGRIARFTTFNAKAKRDVPIDCPKTIAETMLSRVGLWNLPLLNGVIEAPMLLPDGRLLSKPGYDVETGFLLAIDNDLAFELPARPTRDDAVAALAVLERLLAGFPFVGDAERAVVVAAILTAIQRKTLRSAPAIGINAPAPGSGKSLLADVVSNTATGRDAAKMAQGRDAVEDKKRLLAVLMAGDPIACFDNIERTVDDDALCTILTESIYRDRVLGESRAISVPTNATFLLTGNNLTFSGDITSRVLVATIDPKCERPDERVFTGDLRDDTRRDRWALVRAALTILRAYQLAGCPGVGLRPYGRFENWSAEIRAPLVWAGAADPVTTRESVVNDDPRAKALRNLLTAWRADYKDAEKTLREVIDDARPDANGASRIKHGSKLWGAIFALAPEGEGHINTRKLSWELRKVKGRIFDGVRLQEGGPGSSQSWRAESVAGDEPVEVDDEPSF